MRLNWEGDDASRSNGNARRFALAAPPTAADRVNPQADFKAFRDYFTKRFPKVPLNDFVNGPYSMDADLRKQWVAIEEFPPYQFALDKGKEMFATPFKNGKTYGDCFPDKGIGMRQNYPYFDDKTGEVVTLELALNQCRLTNGEAPLDYIKDEMAALTAYMAFTSRGKSFDIKIPERSARARRLRKGRGIFLHPARPAQFLLRELPRAKPGRAYPHRGAGACARHSRRYADLSFGMGQHGNDQPPLHDLQQPGARQCRSSRRTSTIATSNTTCPI